MSDDNYKKFEADCDRLMKKNVVILEEFRTWLEAQDLSKKVIDAHIGNAGFYIDHYLLHYDAIPAAEGAPSIGGFLGRWFIHKALWANESSIRATATSLKKFYTFMVERGLTPPEDLEILKEDIKEEMAEWLEELKQFDSLADENVL